MDHDSYLTPRKSYSRPTGGEELSLKVIPHPSDLLTTADVEVLYGDVYRLLLHSDFNFE